MSFKVVLIIHELSRLLFAWNYQSLLVLFKVVSHLLIVSDSWIRSWCERDSVRILRAGRKRLLVTHLIENINDIEFF